MPDAFGNTTPNEAGGYLQQQRWQSEPRAPYQPGPPRKWPYVVALVLGAVLAFGLLVDALEDELWPLQIPAWWDGDVCNTYDISTGLPTQTDAVACADAVNVKGDPAPDPLPVPSR